MKIDSKSELKERSAALNTQRRFGRERPALQHAYRLRAYLQLRGGRLEVEQRELERVEKVIAELESRKVSGIQRLIKTIIETVCASLNPEVATETTLLDQFQEPAPDDECPYEAGEPSGESGQALPREERVEADRLDGDGWGPSGQTGGASSSGGWETLRPGSGASAEPARQASSWADGDGWGEGSDGWGAGSSGGWSVSPAASSAPPPAPGPESVESGDQDHWGSSEGYSYDDKF